MAKVGKSKTQQEYNKQRRKLIREIEQATQRGFIFPEDVLPEVPKKITRKRVEELKKITPSHLFKSSEYVDVETGEVFTYEQIEPVLHNAIGNIKQAKQEAKKLSLHTPAITDAKEILSEEERKQRNVERGRKAWETRRARMTDEEYGEFRKLFQERMAQSRAQKKGEPYYPKLSPIDAVRDSLEQMDNERGLPISSTLERDLQSSYFDKVPSTYLDALDTSFNTLKREIPPYFEDWFPDYKQSLVQMFDDMVSYHEMNDTITEYEEYLMEHMYEIGESLHILRFVSNQGTVKNEFVSLMTLLNQGALTPTQAATLSDIAEGYQDYEV